MLGEHSFCRSRRLILVHLGLVLTILMQCVCPSDGFAQVFKSVPIPSVSSVFHPVLIRGFKIHPDDPLKFDFLIETGDTHLQGKALEQESRQLIRDFWTALAVPKQDLWVNLSPYEKDRMIPDALGKTRMGHDLLEQDYFLKQLTASLMKPDSESGRKFWDKVYEKIYQEHGAVDIPIETFHKVWIVPQTTSVYENPATNSVVVVESELDVMLEEDYLGNRKRGMVDKNKPSTNHQSPTADIKSILRQTILPLIKEEINTGEQFARLRQIVNAIMLAEWYKTRLTNSLLNQAYADQNKINGIASGDVNQNDKIFSDYVKLFSNGNEIIAEQYDPVTQQIIPQRYLSGGFKVSTDSRAMLAPIAAEVTFHGPVYVVDSAMMIPQGILVAGVLFLVLASFLMTKLSHKIKNEGTHRAINMVLALIVISLFLLTMAFLRDKALNGGEFSAPGEILISKDRAMLALSLAPLLMVPNMMLAIGFWGWAGIVALISSVGFILWMALANHPHESELWKYDDYGHPTGKKPDKAQLSFQKGGIDLAQMNVAAGKSGEGIAMNFDPVLLEKLRSAKTFRPVIFSIRPAGVNILQNSWGIPAQVTKP